MKNIFFFLGVSLLLCYGCKFFKKSSPKIIDTITADTISIGADIVDSTAYYSDISNTPAQKVVMSKTTNGSYYMIVGCFTVQSNADKYAEKLRGMGYEAQIISGRDNFQMVAAKSYTNYRESVSEIDKFRNNVTPNAWVYLKK